MPKFQHLWRVCLLIVIVLVLPGTRARAQEEPAIDYAAEAQRWFDQMSVEERVGQLFLVTFQGSELTADNPIVNLIRQYQVGGVALRAGNNNIVGPEGTPQQVANLTNQLQTLALLGEAPAPAPSGDEIALLTPTPETTPSGIPLFIAINHEGNGFPHTSILNGLTEVPSAMAIGATWQPDFAEAIGAIVGNELSAIGINMLFGPSLDILEDPSAFGGNGLGTRSFGGDPYWVSLMGQAYTSGLHSGSDGRLAVIAKHFPGVGSSDRPLNEEVATVRKTLDQLRQIELVPFFATTGGAPDAAATVDGLLTSHIRYQGFQGDIRPTTPPISFDPQALGTLLQLGPLATWRANNGLIVSDSLGAQAVKRFYDVRGQEFPHRVVANDAFLAGNDLLYLGDFALGSANLETQLANVRDTISWFQEKYQTDQSFQQQVDESVLRILQMKLRLYQGNFSPESVLAQPEIAELGSGGPAVFALGQAAITLISPAPGELVERLTAGADADDDLVIFTDVRIAQQCASCPPQPFIGVEAMEERILALYGPTGSGQIRPDQIESFSFAELQAFLDAGPDRIQPPATPITPTIAAEVGIIPTPGPTPTPAPTATIAPGFLVQTALDEADWIIFAMLDPDPAWPESTAVQTFLAARPDIARRTRLIAFAFDAPYYLDTTEISQLSAYYGVFSKVSSFIDAAVRALFQESPLRGASPVDIEGISYELFTVTQPDPEQIIDLSVADGSVPSDEPLELSVGDILRLHTGVIVDRNGNPVPDGTPVQFIRQNLITGFTDVIAQQPTVDGIAQIDYVLERLSGQFRITVAAGPARNSQAVDIRTDENVQFIFEITLTPAPTATPTLRPTPTATPTATATPTPTATATRIPAPVAEPPEPGLEISESDLQLLLGLLVGLVTTGSAALVTNRRRTVSPRRRARTFLFSLAGGLLAYNYLILDLPGAAFLDGAQNWAGLLAALVGGIAGLILSKII